MRGVLHAIAIDIPRGVSHPANAWWITSRMWPSPAVMNSQALWNRSIWIMKNVFLRMTTKYLCMPSATDVLRKGSPAQVRLFLSDSRRVVTCKPWIFKSMNNE